MGPGEDAAELQDVSEAALQGQDTEGFDEVPLGSPPLKQPGQQPSGVVPSLEKVAMSLLSHNAGETAGKQQARQLQEENARLRQRLAAVENVRIHGVCLLCQVAIRLMLCRPPQGRACQS